MPIKEQYIHFPDQEYPQEFSYGVLRDHKTGMESVVYEGDDVTELLGIEHYNPPEPGEVFQTRKEQYKRWPRSLRGWYYFLLRKLGFDLNYPTGGENEKGPKNPPPVYDVESWKHYPDAIDPDLDTLTVSEKIHGADMRCTYRDGKFYVGSRKLWKSPTSKSIWREAARQNPWLEIWCREHEGYTLYMEVVPCQKLGDKVMNYGAKPGEVKVFIFDVLSQDGKWHLPSEYTHQIFAGLGLTITSDFQDNVVPVLRYGTYNKEDILRLADGPSQVPGADHIREGVVIREIHDRHVTGLGRLQLKIVGREFLARS
jgi:hypothetical protein